MVLFPFEDFLGDKHREVGVLHAKFSDLFVEPIYIHKLVREEPTWLGLQRTLNDLPNTIRPWFKDIATANIIVVQHIGFDQDLTKTSREDDTQ